MSFKQFITEKVVNPSATVFKADSGKYVVYLTEYVRTGELLMSDDGETFISMSVNGFGGNSLIHDLNFEDPNTGIQGLLQKTAGVIKVKGSNEKFYEQARGFIGQVVPIPAIRIGAYLFEKEDKSLIYVSRDKYKYEYSTIKFFVGLAGERMLEQKIINYEALRDGGTTNILIEDGSKLYTPTPWAKKKQPTFNGNTIKKLKLTDFTITELESGVIICQN
jgi:hypothetical protein